MIIHKVDPPVAHRCDPPYNPAPQTLYGEGTIWECDVCKRRAKLVYDQRDGLVWQWFYR